MIKVLVVSPYALDANSYYRCMGPWNYLAKQNRNKVQVTLAQDDLGRDGIAWAHVDQFDLVFFHRPCRPQSDIPILRVCKNLNIPVWCDFDDWLFEVPFWNPTQGIYNNPGLQDVISTFIACSDIVSVSTSALYDRFSKVNPNVVIIPNMYRSDLYSHYRAATPPERKSDFIWRGTNTHDADLMSVQSAFPHLPAKVTFCGGPYWGVLQSMDQSKYETVGSQDPFEYMRNVYERAPKVMLVPLVDCFFNRCKSNIAYQEALHAGALCVAPNLPEWHRPGVITYEPHNAQSFLDAATQAISMTPDAHNEAVFRSWQHMLSMYDAPTVNRIREETLKAVLSSDFKKNTRSPTDQLLSLWTKGVLLEKNLLPQGVSEDQLKSSGIG